MKSTLQPKNWPPPEWSSKDYSSRWWFRIPILGFVTSHIINHLNFREHLYGEVSSIEDDISDQLAQRNANPDEVISDKDAELLEILSQIVKDERGLKSNPHIYLDDNIDILCFGIDNLTLFGFTNAVAHKYKLKLNYSKLNTTPLPDNATVRDLINFVHVHFFQQ